MASPDRSAGVEGTLAWSAAVKCELGRGHQVWQAPQQLQAKEELNYAKRPITWPAREFPSAAKGLPVAFQVLPRPAPRRTGE
jgi:hypothetical protein